MNSVSTPRNRYRSIAPYSNMQNVLFQIRRSKNEVRYLKQEIHCLRDPIIADFITGHDNVGRDNIGNDEMIFIESLDRHRTIIKAVTKMHPTITEEQLLENGWEMCVNKDPYLMEKVLIDRYAQHNNSERGISLVLHWLDNSLVFSLSMIDDYAHYLISINPGSIEELNLFENLLISVGEL